MLGAMLLKAAYHLLLSGDLCLLLLIFTAHRLEALLPLYEEFGVIAGICFKGAASEVEYFIGYAVKEVSVVRYHHDGAFVAFQI